MRNKFKPAVNLKQLMLHSGGKNIYARFPIDRMMKYGICTPRKKKKIYHHTHQSLRMLYFNHSNNSLLFLKHHVPNIRSKRGIFINILNVFELGLYNT